MFDQTSRNTGKKLMVGEVVTRNGGFYKQMWQKPIAAILTHLLDDQATDSASVTEVTSFDNAIDFARNIVILPAGTTADVAASNVTVSGTDIRGEAITEVIALVANQSTVSTGSTAFATVTSIQFAAMDDDGATFDVGVGDKLGLEKRLMFNTIGGNAGVGTGTTLSKLTREGTAPTVTTDTGSISLNTVNFNTALANTKTYAVYMISEDPSNPTQSVT